MCLIVMSCVYLCRLAGSTGDFLKQLFMAIGYITVKRNVFSLDLNMDRVSASRSSQNSSSSSGVCVCVCVCVWKG